jgi:hypothetical protein
MNVDELFNEIALRLYRPSFGPSVVLNLAIEDSHGYGSQPVMIAAANLAGNVVATVEADLTRDNFDMYFRDSFQDLVCCERALQNKLVNISVAMRSFLAKRICVILVGTSC